MATHRPHPPLALTMGLIAALPALLLAWALADHHDPLVVLGWLLLALLVGVGSALALATLVARPLAELERALRRFDPELGATPVPPPAGTPYEVAVLFDRLAAIGDQLHASFRHLRDSARRSDALRQELVGVIGARDRELKGRAEALQDAHLALERHNRTDSLTGVANRRGLAEFLERAWRSAQREQQPLSILMVDIDHLDAYEDARGQARAEACMKAVANTLQHLVGRATDLVAHSGSGRFVVLLGNTPLEGGLRVAEQLRGAIESLAISHPRAPAPGVVTASIGVTSALPPRGARADASLSAAERALDAAKEQGRNQVAYSTTARTGLFQSLCLTNDSVSRPS